ncbi:MAG TPA: DUF3299 domain-containing protein [Methylomirabilota bacterium]|nr:DUF3299 domain-containing protein [Methylomirabilota bacterium]
MKLAIPTWICGLVAAWLLSGCGGQSNRSETKTPPTEVRGELIAPAPESATTDQAAVAETPIQGNDDGGSAKVELVSPPETTPAPEPKEVATATDSEVPAELETETPVSALDTEPEPATVARVESDAPSAPEPAEEELIDGFLKVGFDRLSDFEFDVDESIISPGINEVAIASLRAESRIPKEVRALDQRKIALRGFMLPLKVESGRVTELLIMRDQSMCCYGATPKINEWVSVKMAKEGVKPIMDQPVTLFGKLRVGEMRENGYLIGIYEMEGEKMAGPYDL